MIDEDANAICLSGGAEGADLEWGFCAGLRGHRVRHFGFESMRTRAPESEVVRLTVEQLKMAEPALERAAVALRRSWPPGSRNVRRLLCRNFYQVRDAERVYAISAIRDGLVQGGTGWATTMFTDRFPGPAAAYVFDQDVEAWFTWNGAWTACREVPAPWGIYAGIGSRDLKDAGRWAIRHVMRLPTADNIAPGRPNSDIPLR